MTQRETFAEFAERVKPRDGDTFKDSRGNEWVFSAGPNAYFKVMIYKAWASMCVNFEGGILAHDFIEPAKPKLLAPALYKCLDRNAVSSALYTSEDDARETLDEGFISWPAIPNAQGMYEVEDK